MVGPLDSAVNIAFPSITAAFEMPSTAIQWVIVSYVITNATLLLIFGRVGDLFGHLLVFRIGLIVSALSFLGSGMAQSFDILLATRALQGVGAAMVLSCGPALVTAAFDDSQRVRALGGYAAVIGAGMTIGPSLGGLLVWIWDWPAIFWFRLPIAIMAFALTLALKMPGQTRSGGRFDGIGALALAIALGVLLVAISRARYGAMAATEISAYVIAIVGAAFVLRQASRSDADAVVAFSSFRNRDLSLVTLAGIIVNMVGFAVMLFVPYYLARMTTLPVALAGLILAASPMGIIVGGQCGPALARHMGAKLTAFAGALIVTAATASIGFWEPAVSAPLMGFAACLHGIGLGLYQVGQLDISTTALPRQSRGVAGSLVMLTRTLGVVLAASALTAVFIGFQGNASGLTADGAFLSAFQRTFLVAAGGLGGFLALTLLGPASWMRVQRGPEN